MKKILFLMFVLVICLSLCACGACNCGCCEKAVAEAAVVETVPEETQSQEEYLTELLVSEDWVDLFAHYYSRDASDARYTFLHNGYGIFDYGGDHDDSICFQWVLDGNKLLVMFEGDMDSTSDVNNSDLYIFDNEQGVFTQKRYDSSINNYVETIALIPASRMAEFE